jgi:predicted nucleotidyltransferase
MRLEKRILDKIKLAVKNSFGDVNIYLFGSRVDDNKKGGDIDIAIDSDLSRIEFRRYKAKTIANLIHQNFELKVDIVNYNTKDPLLHSQIRDNSLLLNF